MGSHHCFCKPCLTLTAPFAGGAWYNYMFLSAPDTFGLEFLPMGALMCALQVQPDCDNRAAHAVGQVVLIECRQIDQSTGMALRSYGT